MERKTFFTAVGILFFAVAVDTFTTHTAFNMGASEGNLLPRLAIDLMGPWGGTILEIAGAGAIAICAKIISNKDSSRGVSFLRGANAYITLGCVLNAIQILGHLKS